MQNYENLTEITILSCEILKNYKFCDNFTLIKVLYKNMTEKIWVGELLYAYYVLVQSVVCIVR